MVLDEIKIPIQAELQAFEALYKESTQSQVQLMQKVAKHVLSTKGKHIRPIFALLSAGMVGKISDKTIRAALMLEILHTASLLHDDVVDNSQLRRNEPTTNHLFGNRVAILSGDYFLATIIKLLAEFHDYEFLDILSKVVIQMSEGELLQQQNAVFPEVSEENYFQIIEKKTAILIASCCEAGGISGGGNSQQIEQLRKIGMLVGTAFQIKDDILDYLPAKETGKASGNDLRENKYTLPLIYFLQQQGEKDRKEIFKQIQEQNQNPVFVEKIMNSVIESGSIELAQKKAEDICNQAIEIVKSFPGNSYKTSFLGTINYLLKRTC